MSGKTLATIVAGLVGFGLLVSIITAFNSPAGKPSATPDVRPSLLIEPSPSPTVETVKTKPGRKGKLSLVNTPTTQAKKESPVTAKPSRATSYSSPVATSGSHSSKYITGPRGGCYYINGNGNKTYVDRSMCGGTITYSRPPTSTSRGYITGPRGGCYYINGNGNKTYVDHSFCR